MRSVSAIALAGCVTPQFGSHPPPAPPLETPEIASIDLLCKVDQDQWSLVVEATAWTGGGDSQWTEDGDYVEEHDVAVVSSEEDGSGETLELDLPIVSDWRFQAAGSTVFTCGDAPTVTFVLFDTAGAPVACRRFEDPVQPATDCAP